MLYHRNLRILTTVMFKVVRDISPEIMKEVFHFYSQNNINLRQAPTFYSRSINSVYYSKNSLALMGSKILELVPIEIRSSNSLTEFKRKIKHWKPTDCPCKLCKIYLHQVGYLQLG